MAGLLDGVALRVATGRWPAGTLGTVVGVLKDGALLVEITDEGRTLETVLLPPHAVKRLEPVDQTRLAV